MTTTNWMIWGVGGYILVFMAITMGLVILRSKRRKERPPEIFTLLRGPGETLRRRMQDTESSLELWITGLALFPLMLAGVFTYTLSSLPAGLLIPQLIAIGVILVGGIVIGGALLFRRLNRWRDDRLGCWRISGIGDLGVE